MGQSVASVIKPEELHVLLLLRSGRVLSADEVAEHLDCDEFVALERMVFLSALTGLQIEMPAQWGHA